MRAFRNSVPYLCLLFLISTMGARAEGKFILSKGSAGPVQIGMEVDTLYAKIGRHATKLVDLQVEGFFTPALEVYLDTGQRTKPALVVRLGRSFAVSSITVYDPRFRTEEGIHVGSTLGDLRKEYGIDWVGFGDGPLCARANKLGMTFALDSIPPPEWRRTHNSALIPGSSKVIWILVVN